MRGGLGAVLVVLLAAGALWRAPLQTGKRPPMRETRDSSAEDLDPCSQSIAYVNSAAEADTVPRDVILATVADPVATRLSYAFDVTLDALQLALAQQGYTLERFWLPWGHRAADGGTCAHSTAGVLFARCEGCQPPRKPIAVVLVGESPTSGIRKQAFQDALERLETYVSPDGGLPAGEETGHLLGVVGPTFSASAASLAGELARARANTLPGAAQGWWAWTPNGTDLRIVTGSATVAYLGKVFDDVGGIDFERTVLPDPTTLKALLRYLQAEGVKPEEDVALLVESNTAYGNSVSALHDDGAFEVHVEVPFPLHISRIREKLLGNGDTALPAIFGVESLGLPSDRTLATLDAVPQYSDVSPTFDERALENALASLSREGITYVGIFATDDRDKLFLETEVRSFCPDATLFTVDGSLLLTHPDFARYTTGMLIASTYPLIALNQAWSPRRGSKETRIQFPAPVAEGVFNAMTYVLTGLTSGLLEYEVPFVQVAGEPLHRPPVWITTVGNGGVWPLAIDREIADSRDQPLLSDDSDNGGDGESCSQKESPHSPFSHGSAPSWASLTFLGISLWCLMRCGSLWWSRRQVERHRASGPAAGVLRSDGAIAAALAAEATSTLGELRSRDLSRALTFTLAVILVGYVAVSGVAVIPDVSFGMGRYGFPPVLLSGCTLAIIVAAIGDSRSATVLTPRALVALLLFGALFALALALGLHALAACTRIPAGLLLWHSRAVSLSSGVSPLLPLFFGWLAAYFALRTRQRLIAGAPLALYSPLAKARPFAVLGTLLESNLDECASTWWSHKTWGKFFLPVAAFSLLLRWVYRAPLDGRWFSWAIVAMSAVATTDCIWALAQAARMGRLLDQTLRRFMRSSLATELKQFWDTLPKGYFGRLQTLSLSVDALAEVFRRWEAVVAEAPDGGLPEALRSGRLREGKAKRLSDLAVYGSARAFGSESFEVLRAAAQAAAQALCDGSLLERTRAPARELVAYYLVFLVSWTLSFIWSVLVLAGIEGLCLLLLFSSYPQEPHELLTAYSWLVIGGSLLVGVTALLTVERNEALSLMSGTKSGSMTFDVVAVQHLAALVAGPLVAFLFLQFPGLGRWLADWAQPLLHGLK